MHETAPLLRRQKWHEDRPLRFLPGRLLFHLILFFVGRHVVIWKPAPPTYEFRGVAVNCPLYRLCSLNGAAAAILNLEPDSGGGAQFTPPSMITAVDSSAFKVDASKMMDQALVT